MDVGGTRDAPTFNPFSEEFLDDHHSAYRRLRSGPAVHYNEEFDFYALTRYDDVVGAYRDHGTYSSTKGIDLVMARSDEVPPATILFMDPPHHRRLRGLVSRSFAPRSIEAMRTVTMELVQGHLAAVDRERFDVVGDFSALFPIDIVCRLAGVPAASRQQVRLWIDEVNKIQPGQMARSEESYSALGNAFGYFYDLVQKRRAQLQDDLISRLVEAEIERDDGESSCLDDLEITSFALVLGGAGGETVSELVANAVAVFAQHPEQWQKLVAHPDKAPAAVEELLRFDGPVRYNLRWTLKEAVVQGESIPPGKPVLLCGPAANRDPTVFDDPDTFDIDRDHNRAVHLGFGYGIHTCLGAALARLEGVVALQHLIEFMPKYEVHWSDARRLRAPTVAGWETLPISVVG